MTSNKNNTKKNPQTTNRSKTLISLRPKQQQKKSSRSLDRRNEKFPAPNRTPFGQKLLSREARDASGRRLRPRNIHRESQFATNRGVFPAALLLFVPSLALFALFSPHSRLAGVLVGCWRAANVGRDQHRSTDVTSGRARVVARDYRRLGMFWTIVKILF